MTTASNAQAQRPYERLLTLDVLRGFALFGIFVVNIQFMSQPIMLAFEAPQSGSLDLTLWLLIKTFFTSKFVGVFSLLFGVGFALQWQRAKDAGRNFNSMYLRRSMILMFIGLAHGIFLFEGDILLPYSIAGLLLLALQGLSIRGLKIASAICLLLAVLSSGVIASFDIMDFESSMAKEIAVHREGPLADLIVDRGKGYADWMVFSSFIGFNWRILCAFFLGAALLKSGFFSKGGKREARTFAIWTMLAGVLFEAGLTWLIHADDSVARIAIAEGLHEFTSMILAVGYAGVLRYLVQHGTGEFLKRVFGWIACAGRTALSGYLLQSLLANVYFTFLGFAWYGTLDYAQLMLLVAATYIMQVALSVVWLRYFRAGPFEWAWRSATKLELLPLRR